MSTIGLIYIIGGIISAIIALYLFYNKGQAIKVEDLFIFVIVAIVTFLISWVGVLYFLLIKYGDVVIINKKGKAQKGE